MASRHAQPIFVTNEGQLRLHAVGEDAWEMHDRGAIEAFGADEVRVSILWKAYAFANQAAVDAYHNHASDLDGRMVAEIFATDLRARGHAVTAPGDPVGDAAWKALLQRTYMATFKGAGASGEY